MIRMLPLLLFFLLAVMLLLGLQHQEAATKNSTAESASQLSQPWPVITVKNVAGTLVTLDAKQLGGHVTVINIFASWCEPCKAEMPELVKLHHATQVPFYGIVWNDTPTAMNAWLKTYGNPFDTVWFDNTGKAAIALGVRGVPETFIVDKHGMLRYHMMGAITSEFAAQQILPLIATLQAE